jgi:flagella basal body P-ring formation protein FlgA
VTYAGTRKALLWARVEIAVPFTAVVPISDLPAHSPIDPASLRTETGLGPWRREKDATRIEEVGGRASRHALKAGMPIPLIALEDPPEVRRGDPVTVEVESGPARLRFDAVAENAAKVGEIVELRNPASGKTFKARLGRGAKAFVIIAPGLRL